MSIAELSTEILQRIFEYTELEDLVHLHQTCRLIHRCFLGRQLHHLTQSLHNSYAPLPSLLKLVLANTPEKSRKLLSTEQRTNIMLSRLTLSTTSPKFTLEQMKRMVFYGRVAERWTELYPRLRWRFGSDNRRLLHQHEKVRLRRAIYHHWTYTTLFHSRSYTQYTPDPPSHAAHDDPRHRLLRTYSTSEHIQLSELLAHFEQLVELDLYPSNAVVQDHYSHTLPAKALEKIAWGDGSEYRRLVRDIMKLSPVDLLHLVENTSTKAERLEFLYAKEACFGNVPATLNYALSTVSHERARYGWGIRSHNAVLRVKFPEIVFASLRPKLVGVLDDESDFADEELWFGIVDTEKSVATNSICGNPDDLVGGWEVVLEADGVESGEWAVYKRRLGEPDGKDSDIFVSVASEDSD